MITIEFTKDGRAISDFETEDFVRRISDNIGTGDTTYKVSTSIAILAIRAAIVQGKIQYDKVQFSFEGNIVGVNKFGRTHKNPNGLADLSDTFLCIILGL